MCEAVRDGLTLTGHHCAALFIMNYELTKCIVCTVFIAG